VIDWLSLFRLKKKEQPLTGAPAIRRHKTYSADSGYAYQYYYQGHRHAERDGASGTEYVFEVSAGPGPPFRVPVFLDEQMIRGWQQQHARELTATELYAVAKMALFQAFDERENPSEMGRQVSVRLADMEGILERLDI
jgi:hypothetical protein